MRQAVSGKSSESRGKCRKRAKSTRNRTTGSGLAHPLQLAHPVPCQPELQSLESLDRALRSQDPCGLEISLIDVVVLACDASEDAAEVNDLVAGVIQSGAARILPRQRDPMLVRA